jgi:hypothetical protein
MDDFNQIEVPPSFTALYTAPGGHRLTQPMSAIRERYETCEDMAQMLSEQASIALFKSGGSEREVLEKMQSALSGPESPVAAPEAEWVVVRIAEIVGWERPAQR